MIISKKERKKEYHCKIQHPLQIKTFSKLGIKSEFLSLITTIYGKSTRHIYSERLKIFP